MTSDPPKPPDGNGIPSGEWFRHVFGPHRAIQVSAVDVRLTRAERDALRKLGPSLPGQPSESETAAYLIRDELVRLGLLDPRERK